MGARTARKKPLVDETRPTNDEATTTDHDATTSGDSVDEATTASSTLPKLKQRP